MRCFATAHDTHEGGPVPPQRPSLRQKNRSPQLFCKRLLRPGEPEGCARAGTQGTAAGRQGEEARPLARAGAGSHGGGPERDDGQRGAAQGRCGGAHGCPRSGGREGLCCKLGEGAMRDQGASCSPYDSALARRSCSHAMASVRAHGPRPKARSTIRASPTMPPWRANIPAWPLRSARITSKPLIVA